MKWTWAYPIEDLNLWLQAGFGPKGKGSWCGANSVAEGFGPDEDGAGWNTCTHIHFYGDRAKAIEIYREMKKQKIDLSKIETYSHK